MKLPVIFRKSNKQLIGCLLVLLCIVPGSLAGEWKALLEDGIHDPSNPALEVLLEPADALSQLPADPSNVGNKVRWVNALQDGYIDPRTNIHPGTEIQVLDLDILMMGTGSANYVLFPHQPHTEWLDCSNCHEKLFIMEVGATPINMLAILSGDSCGRCHGAVAFPLIDCNRCHSVPPDEMDRVKGAKIRKARE